MGFDVKDGLQNLMKEAQRMQKEMEAAQQNISKQAFLGQSGAGAIKVTVNGRHDTMKVEIDDSVFKDVSDIARLKKMLEELFAAANNDANLKIEQASKHRIAQVTEKLGIPDINKLQSEGPEDTEE